MDRKTWTGSRTSCNMRRPRGFPPCRARPLAAGWAFNTRRGVRACCPSCAAHCPCAHRPGRITGRAALGSRAWSEVPDRRGSGGHASSPVKGLKTIGTAIDRLSAPCRLSIPGWFPPIRRPPTSPHLGAGQGSALRSLVASRPMEIAASTRPREDDSDVCPTCPVAFGRKTRKVGAGPGGGGVCSTFLMGCRPAA